MKNNEIPKVVLNFNQINNPTQINNNQTNENSVQTISRKVKELNENPEAVKDFVVDTANSFWTYFFKGFIVVLKVFTIPTFLFFFLSLSLLSIYKGQTISHSIITSLSIMYYTITYTFPHIVIAIFPMLIIYGTLIGCGYISARSLGKLLYKNNPEKAKKATRAIFLTQMMLAINDLKNRLNKED